MEKKSTKSRSRQYLALGLIALALWGIALYWWYYAYRFAPVTAFLRTFLVIPIPFLVHPVVIRIRKMVEQAELKWLFNFIKRLVVILLILSILTLLLPRLITALHARSRTFSVKDVPQKRVTIVFGGGVMPNGKLMPELGDRVATAADLYFAGKVEKLLMSGDNRFVHYNEPQAMKDYALQLGVPDDAIVLDYAGRRTYDTCYRARDIFKAQDIILVTQRYHLPRALCTCNALGVNAVGVAADRDESPYLYGNLRELPATLIALWEVHVSHPLPVLGEPEPIFSFNT